MNQVFFYFCFLGINLSPSPSLTKLWSPASQRGAKGFVDRGSLIVLHLLCLVASSRYQPRKKYFL